MKRNIAAAFFAVTLCLLVAQTSHATLVAYDPFLSGGNRGAGEYSPGVDMRTMGAAALGWVGGPPDGFGVAHSGSTGNFQADALGENSPAVSYEQGGRMRWLGVGNFPFDRNLERQLNPIPASSTYWMSIMVNRLGWATASTQTYAVGGFTDAVNNGIQIGYDDQLANDGTPDLVLRVNGANQLLAADVPSSDNQFVMVRVGIDVAGNETIDVWVDPLSISPLPAPDVSILTEDFTSSLTPFTQSRYESPGQSGTVFFDEIRLATTFFSLTGVPEPTTGLLASIGLAAASLVRKRR